ncbi:MAG: hypothetical protein WA790_15830 [Sulfitobacter sp.]
MKLIPDWKDVWRWHSTHIAAIAAALPVAWASTPEDVKAYIPTAWMPWIAGVLFLAFLLGRVRDQP